MKIGEIKKSLKYKNYLYDSTIDIDTIKTTEPYSFICDKGHIFDSMPQNVIKNFGEISCPICSNHRILLGYNDMWTTAPEIAKYLENKDDGYKYTKNSNTVLNFICPTCFNRFRKSPNKMSSRINICDICTSDTSYPEKFLVNFLKQLCIPFEKEKTFKWSGKRRYDFYLPIQRCIIEVNGKQHYTNSFKNDYLDVRKRQYIDSVKEQLALNSNEIDKYIVLDCRKSDVSWIRKAIMESEIPQLLNIMDGDINWPECDKYAISNITKEIWKSYDSGIKDLNELADMYNLSNNSIRYKLNQGHNLGLCLYDSEVAKREAHNKSGKIIVSTMSKPILQYDLNGNYINEYPSIQEAQRRTGITKICDCLKGRKKSVSSYIWKYKDNF